MLQLVHIVFVAPFTGKLLLKIEDKIKRKYFIYKECPSPFGAVNI